MEKFKQYLNWQSILAIGLIAIGFIFIWNKYVAPRLGASMPTPPAA